MVDSPKHPHVCCTEIADLSVFRGNTLVVKGVNLHLHCGELLAIIGPNGGGKSTLLKALLGELPYHGSVKFFPEGTPSRQKPRIGYVPQHIELDRQTPLSVLDLFALARSKRPAFLGCSQQIQVDCKLALSAVEAGHLIEHNLGCLSGGELQKVFLALALCPLPDILLLDEPISGVDRSGVKAFYDTVSTLRERYDLAIVLIGHDLAELAQVCDKMVFLEQEIKAQGTPRDVLRNAYVQSVFNLSLVNRLAEENSPEQTKPTPKHHEQ